MYITLHRGFLLTLGTNTTPLLTRLGIWSRRLTGPVAVSDKGLIPISGSGVDKHRFQFRDFATSYQISSYCNKMLGQALLIEKQLCT